MIAARLSRLICWVLILSGIAALPARAQPAKDMLGVPGPIGFQGTQFYLSWSASRPEAEYINQEYLPAGESAERFTQMFIIAASKLATTPEAAARGQADMIEKRKGSDAVANYAILRNDATGEVILDFLLSDSGTGTEIVEWNAYRYARLGKAGGVALYAISRRAYGDKAHDFLLALKQSRTPAINALAAFDAPKLRPSP